MIYWSLLVPCTCVLVLIPFSLLCHHWCMHAKSFQKCPTPCDPMGYSPSDSSVREIFQARILEWVTCPSPGDLSNPGIELSSLTSGVLASRFFTTSISMINSCIFLLNFSRKTVLVSLPSFLFELPLCR